MKRNDTASVFEVGFVKLNNVLLFILILILSRKFVYEEADLVKCFF